MFTMGMSDNIKSDISITRTPSLYVPRQDDSIIHTDFPYGYYVIGNNYSKLLSFLKMKKGWNGYDADKISKKVVDRTYHLLSNLDKQPKIFPTGRNSIQAEYHKDDNNFAELEISEKCYSIYLVMNGKELERELSEREAIKKMNSFAHEEL